MSPREDREPMSTQRVIPGWSKAGENVTAVFQQLPHLAQRRERIGKMFERIQADNDVNLFICLAGKSASILDARFFCSQPRRRQWFLADVQSDYSRHAMLGHVNGLDARFTSEIEHCLVGQLAPDLRSEKYLH